MIEFRHIIYIHGLKRIEVKALKSSIILVLWEEIHAWQDWLGCLYIFKKINVGEDANMTYEMLHDQFASKAVECKFNKEFKSNSDCIQIFCQESLWFKTNSNPFKSLNYLYLGLCMDRVKLSWSSTHNSLDHVKRMRKKLATNR